MSFLKYVEVGKYIKFKAALENPDSVYGGTVQLDKNGNKVIQMSSEGAKKLQMQSDWFYTPWEEDVLVLEDELEMDNPKVVGFLRKKFEKVLEEIQEPDYSNEDKAEYLQHYRKSVTGVYQTNLISFMIRECLLEKVDEELEKLETE